MRATTAVRLALAALLLCACTARAQEDDERWPGSRLEVLATWSGAEQQRFSLVLREFGRRTGVVVDYVSARHGLPQELTQRVRDGRPPDVAFLPQPALLRELAGAGALVPVDAETSRRVDQHFARTFRDLASWEDRLYGVWFKIADKSLVWYDVAAFERVGAVPPRDLAGLLDVARRLAASGTPAFAVSGRDGWTLTDWFENLLLRTAGPQAYEDLAAGRLRWTSTAVRESLRVLLELLAPEHLPGGTAGALATTFEQSVQQVGSGRAAMVVEGDFVAGLLPGPAAQLGVHVDVFRFPAPVPGPPLTVGGGDVAVLLRPTSAGSALLRFLASPEAAQPWAAAGGFLSPNLDLDLAVYPDDRTRDTARQVLEAGDGFHFDLSDLLSTALGGREQTGLRAELRDLLVHRDVARTAERLQQAAAQDAGR